MYSKFWPKGGLPGILHHYTETLITFEYTTPNLTTRKPKPHSLLFIGGLGDGLATTSYTADLARALQPTDWSLFTLNLTSSYQSWGLGSLDADTNEIAQCLKYIKDVKTEQYGGTGGKVVLMGHSTGSQCVMHYLYRANPHATLFEGEEVKRMRLDGAIMQAPVSDREAIQLCLQHGFKGHTPGELQSIWKDLASLAKSAVSSPQKGGCDTLLPLNLTSTIYPPNTPISARRLLSLYSPDSPTSPGEDDLFSSDLPSTELSKTFGQITSQDLLGYKLMVLFSGADQAVPGWVDKEALMGRWRDAVNRGAGKEGVWDEEFSAVIPGASHALSNDDQGPAREFLVERVVGYLGAVLKQ